MLKIIKLQSITNIIKNTLLKHRKNTTLNQTIFLENNSQNIFKINHKQNSYKKAVQLSYRFSTIQHHYQTQKQMQSQLKQTTNKNQLNSNPQNLQLNEALTQTDPLQSYDSTLYQDLIVYQKSNKDQQQNKSKSMKRKQKLQQLRNQLKDPQVRRQRNRQRHQKQKQKLQQNLIGMSEQQKKQYLFNRKFQKRNLKKKVHNDVQQQLGQPFLVDIAFEHRMNQKQNKSLAAQLQLIMKTIKNIEPAPNVHLCGVKQQGIFRQQLNKMKYQFWPIKHYSQPIQDCLKMQKFVNKKVYYLSPDSPKTLDTIEPNSVFIIGGLVDRTVIKNASYDRAQKLNIEARSLPIRQFMKQRSCLNLDHIVMIICKYIQVKDWKQAFEYGAPKRWKREQGEPGLKQLKPYSSQQPLSQQDDQQKNKQQKQQKQV